ncbi:hypothetical protein CERSUDRAFT_127623 [Gelatoporia subvermispora B]|uniref:F-box domain-containing protein n=1 Tax=Ceriporiopsis subvermispora (strain B) TaxID=914234 RepID=M2QGC6_CERS8|nr:hypothetical protein CERSUDRAFT_127623 [Gelatoporia subvermispora B]
MSVNPSTAPMTKGSMHTRKVWRTKANWDNDKNRTDMRTRWEQECIWEQEQKQRREQEREFASERARKRARQRARQRQEQEWNFKHKWERGRALVKQERKRERERKWEQEQDRKRKRNELRKRQRDDTSWGILCYLPCNMRNPDIVLNPGSLPMELWYIVIDHLSDVKVLVSLGRTCKLLLCISKKVMLSYGHTSTKEIRQPPDLISIPRQILRQPLAASLIRVCYVTPELFVRFLWRCAGLCPNLSSLRVVGGGPTPIFLPPLRIRDLSLAKRFDYVNDLKLSDCMFWNFCDLLRLICAFPSLCSVSIKNVQWRRLGNPLEYTSIVKHPRIQSLNIDGPRLSHYKMLLALPELHQSVTSLKFNLDEHTTLSYKTCHEVPPIHHQHRSRGSLQTAEICMTYTPTWDQLWASRISEASGTLHSFIDASKTTGVIKIDFVCLEYDRIKPRRRFEVFPGIRVQNDKFIVQLKRPPMPPLDALLCLIKEERTILEVLHASESILYNKRGKVYREWMRSAEKN